MKKIVFTVLTLSLATNLHNTLAMYCSQDGPSQADCSQLTQDMDTFPDQNRVLKLENAIKEGNSEKISELIMDGVQIDPTSESAAIAAYGTSVYDRSVAAFPDDEFAGPGAVADRETALEQLRKTLSETKAKKTAWNTEFAHVLHNDLKFLPTDVAKLILGYNP